MPSLAVTAFEKHPGSSRLWLDRGDDDTDATYMMILRDGHLEAYMEAYALMPGEALELILLDWYDDSVEVPPYLQEDMRPIVESILTKTDQINWMIDRNETLAAITVNEDTAPELVEQWRLQRQREEEVAAGHQHREELLLAEEIMSSMPDDRLRAPRTDASPTTGDQPVGLAIQFV